MEQVTQGLAATSLTEYREAFERIVQFVELSTSLITDDELQKELEKELQDSEDSEPDPEVTRQDVASPSSLTAEEVEVTRELAGPFTAGGLMVFLNQPLSTDSWSAGTGAMVQDCRALRAVEEGLHITSDSRLSLARNVSVLNPRPFVCKSRRKYLSHQDCEILYDLVVDAICAKQPDVLLCMGKEAKAALGQRKRNILESTTTVIYSKHPSHYINGDATAEHRRKLLHNIATACSMTPEQHDWEVSSSSNVRLSLVSQSLQLSLVGCSKGGSLRDAQCVEDFLQTINKLCLGPSRDPPPVNHTRGYYYTLTAPYLRSFHTCTNSNKLPTTQDQLGAARARLFPFFELVNGCIELSDAESIFYPSWTVNWKLLEVAFLKAPEDLVRVCEILAMDGDFMMGKVEHAIRSIRADATLRDEEFGQKIDVMVRIMENIVLRVCTIQEQKPAGASVKFRQNQPQRIQNKLVLGNTKPSRISYI